MLNVLVSITLILFISFLYYISPYFNQLYFSSLIEFKLFDFSFAFWKLMGIFLILYSLGIFLYYLKKPKDYQGKAILALRFVIKKTKNKENELVFSRERTAFLAIIVKAFWGPLMLFYLVKNLEWLQNIIHNITHYEFEHSLRGFLFLFNDHLFWFILSLLLLIDVLIYSMGYWIELERLQNRIKSVDPTLSGWVVALLYYVPFNIVTNKIIGWYSSDLPFQDSSYLTIPFIF